MLKIFIPVRGHALPAVILTALLSLNSLCSQPTAHPIRLEPVMEMQYLPADYEVRKDKDFPLLLFLHGGGVAGDGIEKVSQKRQDGWISLFDGRTLEGWSVHSGYADYRVEEGAIVGSAVMGSPNTFLCTEREFTDFILEFEVFLRDPELNSGVQFRSNIAGEEMFFWFRNNRGILERRSIPEDRVYGYQVEIAAAESGSSGGVYDEARRAFMEEWWPEKGTPASRAFRDNEWNQYRVECRGSSIKTIVNGVVVSDFMDSLNDTGIIGLQVHDVGEDPTPYEVRWRNIRIMPLD